MSLHRLALTIVCGLIHIQAIPALSDVIVLQNGRQMPCDSIEEGEKEVRCKVGQSTIGLAKSKISKILKSDPAKKQDPKAASIPPEPVPDEAGRKKLSEQRTAEGSVLVQKKQYAAAIRSLQEAYDLNRTKRTAANLAMAYYYASDLDSAKSYFGEVLLMDAEDTLALNAVGWISAEQGDFAGADRYWRKSYALKPDPVIRNNLQILQNRSFQPAGKSFQGINSEEIERAIASYDQDSETHFQIKYDGGTVHPVLLREILRSLDETYEKLRFDLNVELSGDLEVILYPRKDFLQITGAPDWSGGFNDGRIHLPVGGIDSINSDVVRVIVHELTHSLVDLKTRGGSPAWLQEGLAQYMDGTRISSSEMHSLSRLLGEQGLPRVQTLGSGFMNADKFQASIKYSASLGFLQFLVERHRFDAFPDLLARIGNGQTINEACRMAFGADLADLESQWHDTLRSQ
jgi:tetratricopeptide (TPR) repeat protein